MKKIKSYRFEPAKRSVVTEIYFPKKVEYQGAIHEALKKGLDGKVVRKALRDDLTRLYNVELTAYRHWFDPKRYDHDKPTRKHIKLKDRQQRIKQYASPFFGWSMYEVDGVFRKGKTPVEERTQVIRLIFKFGSDNKFERIAKRRGKEYVIAYRTMLYWAVDEYGKAGNQILWSDHQKNRLFDYYELTAGQRRFVDRHFRTMMQAVARYLDDCALFIFGYLVRAFWTAVLHRGKELEDEIWISGIFGVSMNVVLPVRRRTPRREKSMKGGRR